jgi:hypothetical protein
VDEYVFFGINVLGKGRDYYLNDSNEEEAKQTRIDNFLMNGDVEVEEGGKEGGFS